MRYGLLAWGGPVAQIGLLHRELVEEEKWVSNEKFARVLALYQVIPGPEATELCVFFGMVKKGRLGGFLAGLSFILPGFLLMLLLSSLYVVYGTTPLILKGLYGIRPVVFALVLLALFRLGRNYLRNLTNLLIAVVSALATLTTTVNFLVLLLAGGVITSLTARKHSSTTQMPILLPLFALGTAIFLPMIPTIFISGLKAGIFSFGSAYTAIPFLYEDAVQTNSWTTSSQFLDGIALHSTIPAPLVMIATFVGMMAGGIGGAITMTVAIFLPAFVITLVAHSLLEKLADTQSLQVGLRGVTASVIGLMTTATINLGMATYIDSLTILISLVSLPLLWWRRNLLPLVLLAAAVLGLLI